MQELFGIVTAQQCYLRQAPGHDADANESGIEDQIFSGWAVRVLLDEADRTAVGKLEDVSSLELIGWIKVETHYGYQGYVNASELRLIEREELLLRQDKKRFGRIAVGEADLLSRPDIQALPLELLLKNVFVEVLDTGITKGERNTEGAAGEAEKDKDQKDKSIQECEIPEGWIRVRTASGREGYIHSAYLLPRMDDDDYLMTENRTVYFRKRCDSMELDENKIRHGVVKSSLRYLGTQYRWGGKSSQGIDCSGLVFMSYLENGILLFRDSRIHPDYPMKEISAENLKPGDTIYFPGHVAMYLGEGKYIHSTAYHKTPYVTINSLNPGDTDYRGDLVKKIVAYGSIF